MLGLALRDRMAGFLCRRVVFSKERMCRHDLGSQQGDRRGCPRRSRGQTASALSGTGQDGNASVRRRDRAVYDEGRFIGVLAAHLSWDWVDEVRRAVLSTISDLDASELLVISHDGKILLGPRSELGSVFDPDQQAL